MHKLGMSIRKELLLLRRDIGGVIILFAMPLVLIIAVTLIQDSAYKRSGDSRLPILIVDNDKGSVADAVFENLRQSQAFEPVKSLGGTPLNEERARNEVALGNYQLAIVLPEKLSSDLQLQIDSNVSKIMESFGLSDSVPMSVTPAQQREVRLYFDPAVQMSFKNAVTNNIDKMISRIESRSIYEAFSAHLGEETTAGFSQQEFMSFREISPKADASVKPNSAQHNVPAWTLFAMFFIVIPLSINMVKEKNLGTFIRLRTNPVSGATVIAAKTITYLLICMIQCYMMLAVGVYLFPVLGLPALEIGGHFMMLTLVALFCGLAATGYGILVGSVAKTQEQSAPFGATSVIILAAIGGVWVPVFAMSDTMQAVARSSPMNWGLEAFYDVLLRGASIKAVLPELALLLLFFLATITLALLYDKKKRSL